MYDDEDIPKPVMPEWSTDERAPYSLYRSRLAFNAKPMRPKELRKMRGVYYGMITYIDHQLGRLFGQLKLDGLWDDTLGSSRWIMERNLVISMICARARSSSRLRGSRTS